MSRMPLHTVTGAFGYSGRYIAHRLLATGARVRTLTGHPARAHPLRARLEVRQLQFADPAALAEALRGTKILYNTYWVRFDHGPTTHAGAVADLKTLFDAARTAGVKRVVHVSITNPSLDSPLPYFRGKAEVEQALRATGLSYAILRPALFFGGHDVLINNIAWLLRRFPFFGLAGDGHYGLQPIHVKDFAALAVALGQGSDCQTLDAVGPEIFTFAELVRLVARHVGRRARLVRLPRWAIRLASRVLGWVVRDRVLTRDELEGLMAGLLISKDPPTGTTSFRAWLTEHANDLGRAWASELGRHYRR